MKMKIIITSCNGISTMLKSALNEKVVMETKMLADYGKCSNDEKIDARKVNTFHGTFVQEGHLLADPETWRCLRNGLLKREPNG